MFTAVNPLTMEHLYNKGSSSSADGLKDSDPLLDLEDSAHDENENGADFFDKFMGNNKAPIASRGTTAIISEDADISHASFNLSSSEVDVDLGGSSTLLLMNGLDNNDKSSGSFDHVNVDVVGDNDNQDDQDDQDMEEEDALWNGMAETAAASYQQDLPMNRSRSSQPPQVWSSAGSNFNNHNNNDGNPNAATFGTAGFSSQGSAAGPAYNAVLGANPLNLSLLGPGLTSSSNNNTSTNNLRKKKGAGTNTTRNPPKRRTSAVSKAKNKNNHHHHHSMTNLNKLTRSTMSSDGMMLAHRALLKQGNRHLSQPYNMNNHHHTQDYMAKLPRNAVSSTGVGNNSDNNNHNHMFGSNADNMNHMADHAIELEGQQGGGGVGSGIKNAIWGAPPAKRNSSLFSHLLSSNSPKNTRTVSNGSTTTNNNNNKPKGLTTSSTNSMQDLLWLSKTQTKTQALLRQSSAHSLLRQTSSQSLKGTSRTVDVSYLLPPQHASLEPHKNKNKNTTSNNNNNNIETTSLLHQSCRLYPTTAAVVESALRIDPDAVRRPVGVTTEPKNYNNLANKHKQQHSTKPQEIYAYPLNIAIKHDASMEVIQMLVQAGPDVVTQADGTDGAGTLGIALHHKCSLEIVNTLVTANPSCARVADRRANYPLHIAVAEGLSLEIVKRLHSSYPKALEMRNFHSQTPLDMAQRSTRCPEPVMNYLQSAAFPRTNQQEQDDDGVYYHHHHNNNNNNNNMDNNQHDSNSLGGDLEDALDDIMQTNL